MLQTIKNDIKNLPYISFEEFFTSYVLAVQDSNIDNEMRFFVDNNLMSLTSIGNAIRSTREELESIDKQH